jgi:hypothetical protein
LEKKPLCIYFILSCLYFLVNFVIEKIDLFVGNNWIFDNWFMRISTLKTKWNFFLKFLKPCLVILKTRNFYFLKNHCNFYKLFLKPNLMVVKINWESPNTGWNLEKDFVHVRIMIQKKYWKKMGLSLILVSWKPWEDFFHSIPARFIFGDFATKMRLVPWDTCLIKIFCRYFREARIPNKIS